MLCLSASLVKWNRRAECNYAECRNAKCHYAECHGTVIAKCNAPIEQSVILQIVIMVNVMAPCSTKCIALFVTLTETASEKQQEL